MAPPAGTLRVGRYFLALLALIAVMYAIVFWPGQRHTPKLGLDLEGGTQVIFTARTPGGGTPPGSSMRQAEQIMQERVNGTGVTEATVVIQGSDQLVVSIPGSTNTDVSKLGAAAELNFRGLVMPAVAVSCTPLAIPGTSTAPSGSPTPSGSAAPSGTATSPAQSQPSGSVSPNDAGHQRLLAPTPGTSPTSTVKTTPAATTPAATPTPTPTAAPAAPPCTATPFAALEKAKVAIPTNEDAYNALPAAEQTALKTALSNFNCASAQDETDLADTFYVACDSTFSIAYLLGTVIVPGHEISSASAVAPSFSQGGTPSWSVSLDLKSSGQTAWGKYTSAHNTGGSNSAGGDPSTCGVSGYPCAYYVGFTLDGVVISLPINNAAINGGATQITGSFNKTTANDLANQLKYGALPLNFKADQAQTVSATLGTSQLKSGLLAGGIGLGLVIIYSLLYYRALGLVTISSLLVSGVLIYGALVVLGTQIGFTLSLAGIAGFIVAVGITADSFVVFFERIKDEVHDGRSMRVAIPRAWVRARRTILSADTVSFLAAAILYYFAAGDVKGFAFTLGLSTLLDIVVVFWFTHPLVSLLSRLPAFGSARITGLNAVREGGIVPVTLSAEERRRDQRAAAKAAGPQPEPEARAAAPTIVLAKPKKQPIVADPAQQPDVVPETDDAIADDADSGAEPVDAADEQSEPTVKTTPAPGSAAERAAARRARLRGKNDEKGQS